MSEAFENLKQLRAQQRQEEFSQLASQKRAASASIFSRIVDRLRKNPKLGMISLIGVVVLFVLGWVLNLTISFFLAKSHLAKYAEMNEAGDFIAATDSLAAYLNYEPNDITHKTEYGILLVRTGQLDLATKILQDIEDNSTGSISIEVIFYRALTKIEFESQVIAGMDQVLSGINNSLPAQLTKAIMLRNRASDKSLEAYEIALQRLNQLKPGSEKYIQDQRQVNDVLNLVCSKRPALFAKKISDQVFLDQEDLSRPVYQKFVIQASKPPEQYIYGMDSTLFLNFCGQTLQRLDDATKPVDLGAIAHLLYGHALLLTDRQEEAITQITRSLGLQKLPEGDFVDGTASILNGNFKSGIDVLRRIVLKDDPNTIINLSNAMLHESSANWGTVEVHLAKVLNSRDEVSLVALNNRGILNMITDRPGQAKNDFNLAREISQAYPHAIYNLGVIDIIQQDYSGAVRKFSNLINLKFVLPGLYYYAAIANSELGAKDQARSDLNRAVKDPYFGAQAYIQLGEFYSTQRIFLGRSEEAFRKAVELQPENFEFAIKYAGSLSRNNKPEDALRYVEEIENKFANQSDLAFFNLLVDATRGEILHGLGDPDAINLLESSYNSAEDPSLKARIAKPYAELLLAEGRSSQVIEITREVLSLVEADVELLVLRARALIATRNFGEALTVIRNALTLAPDNFSVQMAAGKIFDDAHQIEDALIAYSNARQIQPRNIDPINQQIELIKRNDPTSSKIAVLNEELDRIRILRDSNPTGNSQDLISVGSQLRSEEAIVAAKEQIDTLAAEIKEGKVDAYSGYQNLAGLQMQIGDFDGALQNMILASKEDASQANIWSNIGRIYLFKRGYDEAAAAYTKAIEIEPTNPNHYLTRASIRKQYTDKKPALSDFNKAIELNPTNPVAYMERGKIKLSLKDYEGGINDFTSVVRLEEKNPCAYKLRRQAYTLVGDRQKAARDSEILSLLQEEGKNC